MSLKKNLLKNGMASTLQKIVRVIEQLVLVPFFITTWGPEYYGEWLTLTIIPSFLAFSDLGFGTAAANTFVLRYASGDKEKAANIAKAGFWVISLTIAIALLLSIITLAVLWHFDIFEKSLIPAEQALIAVSFLMAARLFNFYQQLYGAFYRAIRQYARCINLMTLFSTLNICVSLVVLLLGGNIIIYSISLFFVSIIFNPTLGVLAKKAIDLQEFKSAKVLKDDIKLSFQKGIGYLMSPLWQATFFQGTTFAIRIVLGPTSVAVFNTVRTLSRSLNQIFNIVSNSIFPELQVEIGKKNYDKARQLYRSSLLLVLSIALIGMVFLYFFGIWFYELWTNKTLNPPIAMWNIFILGIGFNALWCTTEIVFRAFNKPFQVTLTGIISAILSVIATYFLSIYAGLTGAACGTILLEIMMALYILPSSNRMINQPLSRLISDFKNKDLKMITNLFKQYSLNNNR